MRINTKLPTSRTPLGNKNLRGVLEVGVLLRVVLRITKDPFICAALVFLLGVTVSSFVDLSMNLALFALLAGLAVLIYTFFFISLDYRRNFLIFALILIAFSLGILRFEIKDIHNPDPALAALVGGRAEIIGVIIEEPEYKSAFREYIIRTESKEKILVRGEVYPEFVYGDKVKFAGTLKEPENFADERGEIFDYRSFLSKDDVYFLMSFAKGELIERGKGNFLKRNVLSLKSKFVENTESQITEPASSLLGGILLGLDEMGKDWEEIFRQVGIIHIIVLSGYNITIIADAVYWLLTRIRFFTRRWILITEAVGIILFVIMVGAGPSVVRAALMAILVLLARGTGRTYFAARALLMTALAMVLWNPKILIFDTGFQLSFLATMGLIWVTPIVGAKLQWVTEKWAIRNIVSDTISTQITVLPLLLYKMGLFSIVSIPANILILPVVPVAMFFGFITGLLGLIFLPLAFPFAVISQILLGYILKVSEIFASFPFASFSISDFPLWLMWLVYCLYVYLYLLVRRKFSSITPQFRFVKKSST